MGNELLLVGDEANGAVYRISLREGRFSSKGMEVMKLERSLMTRAELPGSELAVDLESIAALSERAVFVLSERLHSLVDQKGRLLEYPSTLSELGNRGLEGLALRSEGSVLKVALVWEGGYFQKKDLPPAVQHLANTPVAPVLVLHDLVASGGELRIANLTMKSLQVETPEAGHAFRAPDLEWLWDEASGRWLVAVLLSSENPAIPTSRPGERWKYRRVQRFDRHGVPLPGVIDLDGVAPAHLRGANWEGLAWLEPGRRLVLVHDHPPRGTPWALAVPLDWKR